MREETNEFTKSKRLSENFDLGKLQDSLKVEKNSPTIDHDKARRLEEEITAIDDQRVKDFMLINKDFQLL